MREGEKMMSAEFQNPQLGKAGSSWGFHMHFQMPGMRKARGKIAKKEDDTYRLCIPFSTPWLLAIHVSAVDNCSSVWDYESCAMESVMTFDKRQNQSLPYPAYVKFVLVVPPAFQLC